MTFLYFVGKPHDAFRKHDTLYRSIKAADHDVPIHSNTLLVFDVGACFDGTEFLIGVFDLEDLVTRLPIYYDGQLYDQLERFVGRVIRLRARRARLNADQQLQYRRPNEQPTSGHCPAD